MLCITCQCIYSYMYSRKNICIYVYIYICCMHRSGKKENKKYIATAFQAWAPLFSCVYNYNYRHTYLYIYICVYIHKYIYKYIHIWYTFIHICIYICTHSYIYSYTCICTPSHFNNVALSKDWEKKKKNAHCKAFQASLSCLHHDKPICVTRLLLCVTWVFHTWNMTHSYVWHDSFICVTWLIHMCDMTHSYVWHDSFICGMRPVHVWNVKLSCLHHDKLTCVTWLIICVVRVDITTNSFVWHDSSYVSSVSTSRQTHMCDMTLHMCRLCLHHNKHIRVTWLLICVVRDMTPHTCRSWHDSSYVSFVSTSQHTHSCDMTPHTCRMTLSYVWHDSFICVTWLIYMCDMTHSYVVRDLIYVVWLFQKRHNSFKAL